MRTMLKGMWFIFITLLILVGGLLVTVTLNHILYAVITLIGLNISYNGTMICIVGFAAFCYISYIVGVCIEDV